MRRNSKNIIIVILLLIILGLAYYSFYPLYREYKERSKAQETATTTSTNVSKTPQVTPDEEVVVEIGDIKFPVTGTVGHPASGFLRLLPARGGSSIQYENLNFKGDSELYVYLSKDLTASNYESLGPVKATTGTVTYTIPDDINPSEYPYILTWSKKQNLLFNHVEIPQNPI